MRRNFSKHVLFLVFSITLCTRHLFSMELDEINKIESDFVFENSMNEKESEFNFNNEIHELDLETIFINEIDTINSETISNNEINSIDLETNSNNEINSIDLETNSNNEINSINLETNSNNEINAMNVENNPNNEINEINLETLFINEINGIDSENDLSNLIYEKEFENILKNTINTIKSAKDFDEDFRKIADNNLLINEFYKNNLKNSLNEESNSMESDENQIQEDNYREINIKDYFDAIYEDIPCAYYGDPENAIRNRQQRYSVSETGGSAVYGEMHYNAIKKVILDIFKATYEDVFMDLGSGSGKTPIEFTLLTGGQSIGLEYVQFRHELALKAHAKLLPEIQDLVQFIHADMFTYPIPSATIYMINACMFEVKYTDIALFLLKYGPKTFRVWSIGDLKLPFPSRYIKKYKEKQFPATWCQTQDTTLYWIEK